MGKNCLLLVFFFTYFVSPAQVKLGIIGGPQSASVLEKNNIPKWDSTTGKYYQSKTGLHFGVTAEIPFSNSSRFYFHPSLMYSEKGRNFTKVVQSHTFNAASQTDSSLYTKQVQTLSVQYIDIPLNIAYKLPFSSSKKSSFLLSAGPYLSLFYNGKFTNAQNNSFVYIKQQDTTRLKNAVNSTKQLEVGKKDDSYRTFGYGFNARAGFELGTVTLTAFYSQGVDNFYYAAYKSTFHHKVFGASLGIWLGQTKAAAVLKDRDKDGISDEKDACPLLAGPAITNGCPDKDGDGIADNEDKCRDVAGVTKYRGCPVPDMDNDGVEDEADKCPSLAGLAKYNGCPIPDTDNDGINNETDKCPAVWGVARYGGCPVPDKDNDGVNDEEDKCPDTAGIADNNGCPAVIKEEIKQQVAFAAENIFFAVNSAELLPKSFAPLNSVAALLKNNPSLMIAVHGYTDNTGKEAANLAISSKRALAVKNYLVKNGIAESRITANGYGQANPVGDNNTAAGRTKNRRVELKLAQ